MNDYQCPQCQATETARAVDCCDYCVVKIFLGDANAPALDWLQVMTLDWSAR